MICHEIVQAFPTRYQKSIPRFCDKFIAVGTEYTEDSGVQRRSCLIVVVII